MPPMTCGPGRVVTARSSRSPSSALTDCTNGPATGNGGSGAVHTAEWRERDLHEPRAVITAPGSVTVTLVASAA